MLHTDVTFYIITEPALSDKHYVIHILCACTLNKLCGRPPKYALAPCKLTFDLLNLKVLSELRVTWPTSVPILDFLGFSVLDLGPMYATDRRQTSDRRQTCIIA